MAKVSIECLYCGKKWETWSYASLEPLCGVCGEKRLLRVKEIRPEDTDPFGYNKKNTSGNSAT